MLPRYPIYIPSKGRASVPQTAKVLTRMGLPFYLVVEETEAEEYKALGLGNVLVLPFHDLGQGSIPARNWIWEHAISKDAARHWVIDDNISRFYRMSYGRRIKVDSPGIFCAAEDFTDRYTNVAFSGMANLAFSDPLTHRAPFILNTRIYSITLINMALPYRWRGRYNEDTDICLRALKDGWCTIQFFAFLADKATTMGMKGGNTDLLYATGDRRLQFAKSLREQHPDCVKVVWKYNRWHHQVDYKKFRRNKLKPIMGLTPVPKNNEYGMRLKRVVPAAVEPTKPLAKPPKPGLPVKLCPTNVDKFAGGMNPDTTPVDIPF